MNDEEVALYLKTHPEFFNQYADLLLQLQVPNPHGDNAVSITERQLGVLREKLRATEQKMLELIRFGEENDAIAEKVHRLGVALIGANDLAGTVRMLYAHLGGAFAVPHVAVRLWGIGSGSEGTPEFSAVGDPLKAQIGSMLHPYCGPSAGQDAAQWFGEPVRSLAQIPLRESGREGACFGALVLASEEAQRFYPDMGVLYLNRIGDMAAAALLRVVG